MKNRRRFDQINVIPLIDILLVLLVMVITTATFIKQGILPVDLPEAKHADKKEQKKKEIDIYITKEGSYHLDKEPITLDTLQKRLSTIPKETTVVLRSDKESTFEHFVAVMDILKKLNHKELYIVTKEHQ